MAPASRQAQSQKRKYVKEGEKSTWSEKIEGRKNKGAKLREEKEKLLNQIQSKLPLKADYIIESRNRFHVYYLINPKERKMSSEKWHWIEIGIFNFVKKNIIIYKNLINNIIAENKLVMKNVAKVNLYTNYLKKTILLYLFALSQMKSLSLNLNLPPLSVKIPLGAKWTEFFINVKDSSISRQLIILEFAEILERVFINA